MMPCCNYCYVRYINADDTIDIAELNKAKQEVHGDAAILTELTETNHVCLCRCSCHKKGVVCLH